jgi:hypothetical protein
MMAMQMEGGLGYEDLNELMKVKVLFSFKYFFLLYELISMHCFYQLNLCFTVLLSYIFISKNSRFNDYTIIPTIRSNRVHLFPNSDSNKSSTIEFPLIV